MTGNKTTARRIPTILPCSAIAHLLSVDRLQTSYALVAQLIDKGGEVFWESAQFKASPNGTNGFNAGNAVVRKLMRALKKKYR